LLPDGIDDFAGDLTEQEKKTRFGHAGVPKPDLFEAKPENRLEIKAQLDIVGKTTAPSS